MDTVRAGIPGETTVGKLATGRGLLQPLSVNAIAMHKRALSLRTEVEVGVEAQVHHALTDRWPKSQA